MVTKRFILERNAEGISRLPYLALSVDVDSVLSKRIDNMLFNFVWKNRIHFVKKSLRMNTIQCGGLNFLDFTTLNNTFKLT